MTVQTFGLPKDWKDFLSSERNRAYAKKVIRRGVEPSIQHLLKYAGEIFGLSCGPDLLALRLFPNLKEISESFGCFDAVRYRLQEYDLKDPDVNLVSVGDGCTPRTAATFALRTAWKCYSIDPRLKGGTLRWSAVKNLIIVKDRVQNFYLESEKVVVVCVHSHVSLSESIEGIRAKKLSVVAIPCCVSLRLRGEPDIQYEEAGIISPCRTVKIWKSV